MLGTVLKQLLQEKHKSVSELSKATGIPSTTLYSLIKRDNTTVDLAMLALICQALEIPMGRFLEEMSLTENQRQEVSTEEWGVLGRWRKLDDHGRQVTNLIMDAELARLEETLEQESLASKIIPLFVTPAAAGYASPAQGEDYEDYAVPAASRADFAARIQGDSMEPLIPDGSVVLVTRSLDLQDGDVGLFCVDNDMFCKQYCEDSQGNIYLFSLNRARRDADITIFADSSRSVFCYGKVLLDRRPPLPLN